MRDLLCQNSAPLWIYKTHLLQSICIFSFSNYKPSIYNMSKSEKKLERIVYIRTTDFNLLGSDRDSGSAGAPSMASV